VVKNFNFGALELNLKNETRELINATISSIDSKGRLIIEFTELIRIPTPFPKNYLKAIKDGINITYTPSEIWPGK